MQSRKKFIRQSAFAIAGGILLSKKGFSNRLFFPATHPIGLQLFTLFNVIDDDVKGSLQKVANTGYKEIESAFSKKGGYYGMSPKEFKNLLKDLGLKWKSHHVLGAPFKLPPGAKLPNGPDGKPISFPPMRNLKENMEVLVEEAHEAGIEYLVCANTPISTLDEISSSIEILNKTHELCKKAGIEFAYHNHDAEFRPVEGKIPYDLLLSGTSLKMELDLAWALKGGRDPIEIFKQNPGRFPLWHVKDLDKTHEAVLPVGEGTIDYKSIFATAELAGMQHFFIEHDMPKDPFKSIQTSFENISKIIH